MHPVRWLAPGLLGLSADAGDQAGDPVASEQRLEVRDVGVRDSALGKHDGVDVGDLVQGGDQCPLDQIEVEPLGWRELEETKRLLRPAADGALERSKVRLADPQRPRQQEKGRVLGTGL